MATTPDAPVFPEVCFWEEVPHNRIVDGPDRMALAMALMSPVGDSTTLMLIQLRDDTNTAHYATVDKISRANRDATGFWLYGKVYRQVRLGGIIEKLPYQAFYTVKLGIPDVGVSAVGGWIRVGERGKVYRSREQAD